MLIPLGTDRRNRRRPVVTVAMIAGCVGVFAVQVGGGNVGGALESALILDPGRVRSGEGVWTLATYALLHAGWLHLIVNMLFLWTFGPSVEDRLGHVGFALLYVLGAASAGGVHALAEGSRVVGASGAVSAVTGAYLVLLPRTHVRTLFFFFFVGVVQIPAWWLIGAQIAWNVLSQASGATGNVAVAAHLGGYGFGIAAAWGLVSLGVVRSEGGELPAVVRQARRRRAFAEAEGYERRRVAGRGSARGGGGEDESARRLAEARAEVARRLVTGDREGAMEAYRSLLRAHGHDRRGTLLSRRHQYDLSNALYLSGDWATAAAAYERFIEGYPDDPETPAMKVLLGRLLARQLNDPVRARRLLSEALSSLEGGEEAEVARRELEALG